MTGIRADILDKAGIDIGVDRAGNASHEARSTDHILGASTADIEYRPNNSKDTPVPISRGHPKKAIPQKQLLIKRSSSHYPPLNSLDELSSKKKSPRGENLQSGRTMTTRALREETRLEYRKYLFVAGLFGMARRQNPVR